MRNGMIAAMAAAMMVAGCSGSFTFDTDQDGKAADGKAAAQSYAFDGFTGVEVTGPDDVTIRQGDRFSIRAEGPKAALDQLEIVRDGATLKIGRKHRSFRIGGHSGKGVEITITMPRLDALRLTGSGTIFADKMTGDALAATVTGSGDVKVAAMEGKSVDIRISGSGDVAIDGGTVASGDIGVTGSGSVSAGGLVANALAVSVTGSGDVDAQARGTASINIMGSGDVTLTGGAACTTRRLGSGNATCK